MPGPRLGIALLGNAGESLQRNPPNLAVCGLFQRAGSQPDLRIQSVEFIKNGCVAQRLMCVFMFYFIPDQLWLKALYLAPPVSIG